MADKADLPVEVEPTVSQSVTKSSTDTLPAPASTVRIKPQQTHAGGWGAIGASLRYAYRQTGLWRGTQAMLQVNQKDGFDCPGCAWPDPTERSRLEFCENGLKAVAHEATKRRVAAPFFDKWPLALLSAQSDHWLEAQGRLTRPMHRPPGHDRYVPIDWDRAFELIANALMELASPDEAVFYTSGRTSNEAAFLYQLMARQYGTNNLPDCSNMCHESSGKGLSAVIGVARAPSRWPTSSRPKRSS